MLTEEDDIVKEIDEMCLLEEKADSVNRMKAKMADGLKQMKQARLTDSLDEASRGQQTKKAQLH